MNKFVPVLTLVILSLFILPHRLDAGEGVRGWKGTVRYSLNLKEDIYRHEISFMKLKGLRGQDFKKIIFEGEITFIPTNRPNLYVAAGEVKYDVSLISVARLGEAMVVHVTEGKGTEKVEPVHQINYLRIDKGSGTYSISVSPGVEDDELGAFGVPVLAVSYMKVTRAVIEKMESENRKIPFPGMLKRMFPDIKSNPDRESIRGEAFNRPFPGTATLKDSSKDEMGGVFSWHLQKVVFKNVKPLQIQSDEEEEDEYEEY